jgi:hypothetical protein
VRIVTLDPGDRVAAASVIPEEEAEESESNGANGEQQPELPLNSDSPV